MSKRPGELVQPKPYRQTVYVCDRCKKEAPGGQWPDDPHGDTTIECKTNGEAWAEYDTRVTHRLDLCTKCFVEWLIPLVQANGVEFASSENESNGGDS